MAENRNYFYIILLSALIHRPTFSNYLMSTGRTICPPMEEGKNYTLTCDHRTESFWQVMSPPVSIPRVCPLAGNFSCDWSELGHVTVTYKQDGGKFNSLIRIPAVNHFWRNITIQCLTKDLENKHNHSRAECTTDTFHKPEAAECNVTMVTNNHIRVTCKTSRVYPELICHVTQYDRTRRSILAISQGFEYKNEILPNQETPYYNSSCSLEITQLQPGMFQHFVAMLPAVKSLGYVRNISIVVKTKVVKIEMPTPSVFINPPIITHLGECAGGKVALEFTCRAQGFDEHLHFDWFVWDPVMNEHRNNVTVLPVTEIDSSHSSSYRILVHPQQNGNFVVCSAFSPNLTANASILIDIRQTETPVAQFILDNGQQISDTISLLENVRYSLTCEMVPRQRGNITLHKVQCFKESHEILSRSFQGQGIRFNLTGAQPLDGCYCTCHIVQHCYTLTSTFFITVISRLDLSKEMTNKQTSDIGDVQHGEQVQKIDANFWIVLLIIAGVVGTPLLVLVISFAVLFLRARCHRSTDRHQRCPNGRCQGNHVYQEVDQ